MFHVGGYLDLTSIYTFVRKVMKGTEYIVSLQTSVVLTE
jgi:hypothetical protein